MNGPRARVTWPLMLRRALQLVRRDRGRSWSVAILLILLTALVALATAWPSAPGPAFGFGEGVPTALGGSDTLGLAYATPDGVSIDELETAVSEALPGAPTPVRMETAEFQPTAPRSLATTPIRLMQADWSASAVAQSVTLIEGAAPLAGEAMISPGIAARSGLGVGDELRLAKPAAALTISGIAYSGSSDSYELMTSPDEFISIGAPVGGGWMYDFVDTPLAPTVVVPSVSTRLMNSTGFSTAVTVQTSDGATVQVTPSAVDYPRRSLGGIGLLLGAALALVIGVGAGAAFGIGSARRARSNGLLIANGATRSQLRIATIAEVVVIAIPAVAVGIAATIAGAWAWGALRLPRWDVALALDFEVWPLAVAAVFILAGSLTGALWFSRPARATDAIPTMLDGRPRQPAEPARSRLGGIALLIGLLAVVGVLTSTWTSRTALVGNLDDTIVALVVLVGFIAAVVLVAVGARRMLARRPTGRIVVQELLRRPTASLSVVVLIALWSSVVLASAARSTYDQKLGTDSDITVTSSVAPVSAQEAAEQADSTITIGQEPLRLVQTTQESPPPADIDELAAELSSLGMQFATATFGTWTGPCEVCAGIQPVVAVLERTEGAGQTKEVNDLLEAGFVVTDFSSAQGATIGGREVAIAPIAVSGAQAIVLTDDDAPLADPALLQDRREVLIGSITGLDSTQLVAAQDLIVDAEVAVEGPAAYRLVGTPQPVATANGNWWWSAVWLVPLIATTLAATAAYRREHGQAARVLTVLGASGADARRLAALTAGTLSLMGVIAGIGVGLIGSIAALSGSDTVTITEVLFSSRFLGAIGLAIAVAIVTGALAWLLPPATSPGLGEAPA